MRIQSIAVAAIMGLMTGGTAAAQQQQLSAGASWTSSYGFPTPAERALRLQYMDAQRKLSSGYYLPESYSNTTNNFYDSSVGDTTITAAEGAHVQLETRTGTGSGTNSYVVGSINTSTNTITVDGDNNGIDIVSSSTSDGCQNGNITTSLNQIMDAIDISASASGASASATSGSSVSTGASTCN